jgi:hypothetical protein
VSSDASVPPGPLAPFDPADGVAEPFGDADIVILALRDVQDVLKNEAVDAEAPAHEAKEIGSGFSHRASSTVTVSWKGSPRLRAMCSSA